MQCETGRAHRSSLELSKIAAGHWPRPGQNRGTETVHYVVECRACCKWNGRKAMEKHGASMRSMRCPRRTMMIWIAKRHSPFPHRDWCSCRSQGRGAGLRSDAFPAIWEAAQTAGDEVNVPGGLAGQQIISDGCFNLPRKRALSGLRMTWTERSGAAKWGAVGKLWHHAAKKTWLWGC